MGQRQAKIFTACAGAALVGILALGFSGNGGHVWYARNVRVLPETAGDLASYLMSLPSPTSGYGSVSSTRAGNLRTLYGELLTALDDSVASTDTRAEWCAVKAQAGKAGYAITRFYDTTSGQYFILLRDVSGYGQATVVLQPSYGRNLLVEAPHTGNESLNETDRATHHEGIALFLRLGARALILNREDRCASATYSTCTGTTDACSLLFQDQPFRIADAAHDVHNAMYLTHVALDDAWDPLTVQLHTMQTTTSEVTVASDGSTGLSTTSISARFRDLLTRRLGLRVVSCQDPTGTFKQVCGTTNVEARYTDGASDACTTMATTGSGRFLHLEQLSSVAADDADVAASLADLMDGIQAYRCNDKNGLGCGTPAVQPRESSLTCP